MDRDTTLPNDQNPVRPERILTFHAANSHRRFMGKIKYILPVLTLGLFLFFLIRGYWIESLTPFSSGRLSIQKNDLILDNPTIEGQAGTNLRFNITAKRSEQNLTRLGELKLIESKAIITYGSSEWISLTSGSAQYDKETQKIYLSEGIEITTDNRYHAKIPEATVDLATGRITSPHLFNLEGPDISLQCREILISNKEGKLIFIGPIRIMVHGAKNRGNN